jgi:AcrR family transcriptional regulator/DNA-binding MarR family transcriptional regulator
MSPRSRRGIAGRSPRNDAYDDAPRGDAHDDARRATAPGRARYVPACDSVDRAGGRSGVAEIQRVRMLAALAEVARERGISGVTVAHVVARSGVSRRTFYELFEDREDCFHAAFELAVGRAAERVVPAYRSASGWREQMRAGVGALLEFLEDEPDLGALCVVEALGAGPRALEDRARVVGVLVDAVHEGRAHAPSRARPTRLTAEGVVGAVLAVLHARLATGYGAPGPGRAPVADGFRLAREARDGSADAENGSRQRIGSLLGPLMGMIVLPYLGAAAAAPEAARPAPARRRAAHAGGDPLRDLRMRLTYRTVRVVLALASHPGASNREVADAAGVRDQGQISKLLARLEHLRLIENRGTGASRGEPNAWCLTRKGGEIAQTLRQQGAPAA